MLLSQHLHLQCGLPRGSAGVSLIPLFGSRAFSQKAGGKKLGLQEWPSWSLLAHSPGFLFPRPQFSFNFFFLTPLNIQAVSSVIPGGLKD